MKNGRYFGLLLQPSAFSLVASLSLTTIILVSSVLSYSRQNDFLIRLLHGSDGVVSGFEQSKSFIDEMNHLIFGNSILNNVLFFVFWICLGLMSYFVVSFIGQSYETITKHVEKMKYVNAQPKKAVHSLVQRLAVKSVVLIVWLLYCFLFLRFFVPFSILSTRVGLSELPSGQGVLFLIVAYLVLLVCIHLHAILLRLFMLRLRVFGDLS